MNTNSNKKYRYPGIRSFEVGEANKFFGRTDEARELFRMIKVERFFVLFSKSGIGKTSLLNAGLIPKLTQSTFYPIKIRFQNTDQKPIELFRKAINHHIKTHQILEKVNENLNTINTTKEEASLWTLLKASNFQQNDLPATPILILDQFEEFFLHKKEDRQQIVDCLSDIIYQRVPSEITKQIRKTPRAERTEELLEFAKPLDWKIIFSIRSDRLSLLDQLSEYIPIILNNRYQLHPMNEDQTINAIVEPAKMTGDEYITPPFLYSEDSLKKILNNLSNKNGEVESFQLQIICQYMEQLAIQNNNQ